MELQLPHARIYPAASKAKKISTKWWQQSNAKLKLPCAHTGAQAAIQAEQAKQDLTNTE